MATLLAILGDSLNLTSKTLLFLSGALIPLVRLNYKWAIFISIENFLILNYFFTPPVHTFSVKNQDDFITLMVFLILSIGISSAIKQKGIYSPSFSFGSNQVPVGDWLVDFDNEVITDRENPQLKQHLTPTEWRFLTELFKAKGKIVTQSDILHKVWGDNYEKESHYLRLFMSQLRKKLEPDPSHPKFLITEAGRGYRLLINKSE